MPPESSTEPMAATSRTGRHCSYTPNARTPISGDL
jgi:hypothetical protein